MAGGGDVLMEHAVVLAGGSGTRFWPESRMRRSKQFLNLTGEGTMIAETVRRLLLLVPRENIWVVAGEKDSPHLSARGLGTPARELSAHPATGYGYIERGALFRGGGNGVYLVRRFTEKPDLRTARRFLRSGRVYRNSGVFLCQAATYRDRMGRFRPPAHRRQGRGARHAREQG